MLPSWELFLLAGKAWSPGLARVRDAVGLSPAGLLVVAGNIQNAPRGPCWPLKPVNKPQLQVIKEAFAG